MTINSRREERVFKAIKQVTRRGAHVSIDALGLAELNDVFDRMQRFETKGFNVITAFA